MRAFANYILRGRWSATLVVVTAAILSLVLPLLSSISSAAVALVTLRHGAREGGLIVLFSTAVLLAVAAVMQQDGTGAFVTAGVLFAVLWLPVWLLSIVLRWSVSLPIALSFAGVIGLVAVTAMHVAMGDVYAWWRDVLDAGLGPILEQSGVPFKPGQIEETFDILARSITGVIGSALVISMMIALFIGRWWQSLLFNEGGFQREFHALRLDKRIAYGALVLMGIALFADSGAGSIVQDLIVVVMTLFMIHGLGLLHGIVAAKGISGGWLVAVYILMVILPQLAFLLAIAGLLDSQFDFRSKIKA
ncbi:MAG TPA: DUF2232 domain-containing protein [Crenotrichaceae bacterium]|nr:DUF2232 domain-containing protein [Crenotrichaceae bacterium]